MVNGIVPIFENVTVLVFSVDLEPGLIVIERPVPGLRS
jgi:hypothetical protein